MHYCQIYFVGFDDCHCNKIKIYRLYSNIQINSCVAGKKTSHLDPSGSFLSKEVLRGITAWCCWRICWHCRRSGACVGEFLDKGGPELVGIRCHVVFLLKGVLYSQGVPSLSTLYSTIGMRYSSEHPLRKKEGEKKWLKFSIGVTL